MKRFLQILLMILIPALPVFAAETTATTSKTATKAIYSSAGRLKPEAYKDEARARKLLRDRDSKVNEIIAERQRLLQKDEDIRELWTETMAKYCRAASYLHDMKDGDDPEKFLASKPEGLALYREAGKSLARLATKIENRRSIITLTAQLTDIDFELDRLELLEKPAATEK